MVGSNPLDSFRQTRSTGMRPVQIKAADVPPGAVLLSPDEVLKLHYKFIKDWEPKSEMWPLTYGSGALGGFAAITGLVMNNIFRTSFKLRSFGRGSSYLPTVAIPTALSMVLNNYFVVAPLLLDEMKCPLCTETRAVSLQLLIGFIQPVCLGALASSALAKNYKTFAMPSMLTQPRLLFGMYGKLIKKNMSVFALLFGLNMLGTAVVTKYQGDACHKLHREMQRTVWKQEK